MGFENRMYAMGHLLEVKDDECGQETHRHVRTCERFRGEKKVMY
jgi:hypothetical protein